MKRFYIVFPLILSLSIFFSACDDDDSKAAVCGDGVIEGSEVCDASDLGGITCSTVDGTAFVSGELKCNATCSGFDVSACISADVCGNGILEEGEECDTDVFPDGTDCESLGFTGGTLSCTSDCKVDNSLCEGESELCGNGEVEPGEECDGTNLNSFTCEIIGYYGGSLACGSDCKFDLSGCEGGGYCGDGIIQTDKGEECDRNELNGMNCESFGYYGGFLSCSGDCKFNVDLCKNEGKCGDGIIQSDYGEECDSEQFGDVSCVSLGYYGGQISCTSDCNLDTSACITEGLCGDGIIQEEYGEECDGTDLGGVTCGTYGYYYGTTTCTDDCKLDISDCYESGKCGDGTIQSDYGEECDGSNFNGLTCVDFGYVDGLLACTSDCKTDFTGCHPFNMCGDGIIQTDKGEECEPGNLLGQTCVTLGYYGGDLTCDSLCTFDVSDCESVGRCGDNIIQENFGENCERNYQPNDCYDIGGYQSDPLDPCSPVTCYQDRSMCKVGWDNIKEYSMGAHFSCGIKTDGTVWCWGNNYYGQLGQGNHDDSLVPLQVGTDSDWESISISAYTVHLLKSDGTLWGWGRNQVCQLGDGSSTDRLSPVQIGDATDWAKISHGYERCGIKTDGTLWCWGSNYTGAVGVGDNDRHCSPVQVGGSNDWDEVYCGDGFTCAFKTGGQLYCWGGNKYGEFGNGDATEDNTLSPLLIDSMPGWIAFTVGNHHACGIKADHKLYCWGGNSSGQLGIGNTDNKVNPTFVGDGWESVSAKGWSTCGIKTDGTVWCWSNSHYYSQSLYGDSPTQVGSYTNWVTIHNGWYHKCAVTDKNRLYCWDENHYGQLGVGSTVDATAPVRVNF